MKNILIVCPRFPPKNAADSHRVRLSLPYYEANGWHPTVLSVADNDGAPKDEMLLKSLPDESRVIRIPIWSERICRKFGFGQLDYRSFIPLAVSGSRILRNRHYDVVLFSSTVFLSFMLGPIWKRLYGCKIVYDYQDPWYYGSKHPYTKQTVPGTWWKFKVGQIIARVLEPIALRSADHIISVSQGYVEALSDRYSFLTEDHFSVIPFPASKRDYEFVETQKITQSVFRRDGKIHWVYAGRGGHDMRLAAATLLKQLGELTKRRPQLRSTLKVHFIGTSYAPEGRSTKSIEPIAREFGVEDMIEEQPDRIPYFEALSLYKMSDLIVILGSDAAEYTASKLFNCVLADKKILALFHRASLVTNMAKQLPSVFIISFDEDTDTASFEEEVMRGLEWALSTTKHRPYEPIHIAVWLAEASTSSQCAIFDRL